MDSGSGGRLPRARLLPHSPLLQRSASTASTGLGGEGLPQTTPLLSRRGCKWGSSPLSSMNNQPNCVMSRSKHYITRHTRGWKFHNFSHYFLHQ